MSPFLTDILSQPMAMRTALRHYFAPENLRTLDAIGHLRDREVIFTGMEIYPGGQSSHLSD